VSQIAAQKLTGQMLAQGIMSKNPLFTCGVGFGNTLRIDATSASMGNPSLTLAPETGDLKVHVDIPLVNVALSETNTAFYLPNLSGTVSADHAILDAQVAIQVTNGVVTTSIINDTVTFQNFDFAMNGLLSIITNIGFVQNLIQNEVQSQISNMVKNTLPGEVNKMIAGATGQPLTMNLMGQPASFSVAPNSISIDSTGLNAGVDTDCSILPKTGYMPLTAPGSLLWGGSAPNNTASSPMFFASANGDLMNRAGYAAWKAGLVEFTVDSSPQSIVQLPSWLPLDMGLLQTFIPELQGKAPGSDQISLKISPQLPPVFAAQPAPATIQAQVGDLQLQIWDSTTNTLVLALSLHVKLGASMTIKANATFDAAVAGTPFIDCSLASSPLAPNVNTTGIDNLVGYIVPPVLNIVGGMWSGFPLPIYPGLIPTNVSMYQDGPQGTFVTASGDVQ
jgi:hypothetical protein